MFFFSPQIRFLCLTLLVVCLIPNQVLLYSPFRFRFRAFPESSNLVPNVNSNQGFRFHQKRSYGDLDCGGMYDPSIFAQLDGICEDCYNLYRSPEVHGLCRYLLAFRAAIRPSDKATKTFLFFSDRTFAPQFPVRKSLLLFFPNGLRIIERNKLTSMKIFFPVIMYLHFLLRKLGKIVLAAKPSDNVSNPCCSKRIPHSTWIWCKLLEKRKNNTDTSVFLMYYLHDFFCSSNLIIPVHMVQP